MLRYPATQSHTRRATGIGAPLRLACLCLALSFTCACAALRSECAGAKSRDLQVRFVIDKHFDATRIYGILRSQDPAGLPVRAASMGIPLDIAMRIQLAGSYAAVEPLISRLTDTRYQRVATNIQQAHTKYMELWRPMAAIFSDTVTAHTDHDWLHNPYVCVVSAFHPGLSDWRGATVAAGYDLSPRMKRRIAAHEIVLSHVFQLVRARATWQVSDWQLWAFAEITAVFILSDPALLPFWPGLAAPGSYFSQSNYPQLAPLEKELWPLFHTRTCFSGYLERAYALVRAFSDTHAP